MGNEKLKSLTETGIKYIYKYLLLQFFVIFIIMLSSISLFFNKDVATFFLVFILLELLLFSLPLISLTSLFNGRNEFGQKHSHNITIGLVLIIVYFFILLIELIFSKGLFGASSIISAAADGFSTQLITQVIIVITLSIISSIVFGKALIYFISELVSKDEMKNLKKIFILLVVGPITLEITTLIALRSFYKNYKSVYKRIRQGSLKLTVTAPCPNCNRDIPVESKMCSYCGTEFMENPEMKID
jgi:hypothetical protein